MINTKLPGQVPGVLWCTACFQEVWTMGAVIAASIAAVLSLAAVVLQVKNANTDQTRAAHLSRQAGQARHLRGCSCRPQEVFDRAHPGLRDHGQDRGRRGGAGRALQSVVANARRAHRDGP